MSLYICTMIEWYTFKLLFPTLFAEVGEKRFYKMEHLRDICEAYGITFKLTCLENRFTVYVNDVSISNKYRFNAEREAVYFALNEIEHDLNNKKNRVNN